MKIIEVLVIFTFIVHLVAKQNHLAALASKRPKNSTSEFNRKYNLKKNIDSDWFDPVMNQLSRKIVSHLQIQTFINDGSKLPPGEVNHICQKISTKTSNRIINYMNMAKQPVDVMSLVLFPGTKSTIELIFVSWKDDVNELTYSIYEIVSLTTYWILRAPRPKTLIIIFGCINEFITDRKMAAMLYAFWKELRLFDFAAICVYQDRQVSPKLILIDPFTRHTYTQKLIQ